MKNNDTVNYNRRDFILKTFSSCTLCCLAGPSVLGSDNEKHPAALDEKHTFLLDSGMSLQEVYNFAFKQWYIPAMKNLMDQIGHEKFIEMLKKSSDKLYETSGQSVVNYEERTLTKWTNSIKKGCENWSDRLTTEIVKDDENEFVIKFTECLWAKTFREADASEIGYAGVCYQDYGMTKQYHPKLTLIRKTTLMQGHDYCHFRWFMES
jgi:hypothetical protein